MDAQSVRERSDRKRQNIMLSNLCTTRFSYKNSLYRICRKLFSTSNGRVRSNEYEQLQKRCNYTTAVKGKPKTVSKIEEKTHQVEKIEDKRVPELLIIVKQLKEHMTQLSQIIEVLYEKK